MNAKNINAKFAALGARVKIGALASRSAWGARDGRLFTLDVQKEGNSEFFELRVRPDFEAEFTTLDVQPLARHLLLMVKGFEPRDGRPPLPFTEKFLCGHDERHWFVAATPGGSTVAEAKEALKPPFVRQIQSNVQLKAKDRHSRKNAAFVRQGEWFFIPCPDLVVADRLVLKNEPLRRGRGKPHIVQFLYRRGGTTVHVCNQYPSGLTESEFKTS
ncbi:MAG: hypothetical protein HY360_05835 [Verrucomicrobia bacterium]|nr:hypothetical protein [Verrucomicrobiota bacterium]